MRIATWNLQRPRQSKPNRVTALKRQINDVDADIWIFTETSDEVTPGVEFRSYATPSIARCHSPGENRTTVWTRLPVVQQIPAHDLDSAVCVEVHTSLGSLFVYGTVIPYDKAGTRYAYRSAGRDHTGKRSWELHYESIARHEEFLKVLRAKLPNSRICVAGDLNQSRDGRIWPSGRQWYGTQKGRQQFGRLLDSVGMTCVTEEDFVAVGKLTIKSSVDHICLDRDSAERVVEVDAWEASILEGKRVSDHNGVVVEIDELPRS